MAIPERPLSTVAERSRSENGNLKRRITAKGSSKLSFVVSYWENNKVDKRINCIFLYKKDCIVDVFTSIIESFIGLKIKF